VSSKTVHRRLLLWTAAALCCGWTLAAPDPACSAPGVVFCSEFEEGDFSIWDDFDGNPSPWNLLVQDPGPVPTTGNHVARLRVPDGRGTTDLVKVLPARYDRLYARWYQQWEPGYDFSVAVHGGGLHAGDRGKLGHSGDRPAGDDWFSAWLEPWYGPLRLYTYYRGMYQDCVNPAGSCWGDDFPCFRDEGQAYCTDPWHRETIMPPTMQTGRWYCLEMMMDGGTPVTSGANADGQMNFWIDGTAYGPWNDLWFRTTPNLKLEILWLSLFHHDAHSVEGIMLDNVVVSTDPIGCLGGGGPTPIPSPQNLQRTDRRP